MSCIGHHYKTTCMCTFSVPITPIFLCMALEIGLGISTDDDFRGWRLGRQEALMLNWKKDR